MKKKGTKHVKVTSRKVDLPKVQTHRPEAKPRPAVLQLPAKPVPVESLPGEGRRGKQPRSGSTYLVRDLEDGAAFEVLGTRYIKIHSNDCRAYVRLVGKRHVRINPGLDPDTCPGAEFDSNAKGINISPNTEVTFIDEEVESLI